MSEERALIGLIMNTRDGLDACLAVGVTESAFIDPVCRSIFKAMRSLDNEGQRVSLPNLVKALGPDMVDDLASISANASISQNVEAYAKEILNVAQLREMRLRLMEINSAISARQTFDPIDNIKELWESRETLPDAKAQKGPVLLRDAIPLWVKDLEDRYRSGEKINISTGFPVINLLFQGGWHRGGFYVIAARPGRGKTTFALSSAINSIFEGHKVFFATLEMTTVDIVTKAVSNVGNIRTASFVKVDLTEDEVAQADFAAHKIENLPLWIDHSWGGSFEQFAANCRRVKRRHGLDVIFLDYIGLARLGDRSRERKEELDEISKRCKLLAMELDVAFVGLAQLNRESEKFDQPSKYHIADSDNLCRDADGVLLLYRRKGNDKQVEHTRVTVDKNRWGKEADFPVIDELGFSRFKSANLNLAAFES